MVPQPDTNKMNNDNSNTSQGDQIAAAFIRAVVDAVLVSPDLNKSLISFSNSIEILKGRMDVLEKYSHLADREQLEGEISELRDQLNKVLGRVEEVEDTVSGCEHLEHRVDDLEGQVEDLDAVSADNIGDLVAHELADIGPCQAKNIVLTGLKALTAQVETEDNKI